MSLPPYGYLGTAAAILAIVLAAVVFATAPARRPNQALAALLFIEAGDILSSSVGVFYLMPSAANAWAMGVVHIAYDWLVLAAYLNFIGIAVGGPLAGWLRPARVRGAIAAVCLLGAVTVVLWPEPYLGRVITIDGRNDFTGGPLFLWLASLLALEFTFGLAAAAAAWYVARPGPNKRRNGTYALAILFRDVPWAIAWTGLALLAAGAAAGVPLLLTAFWALPAGWLIFLALLTYGLLRDQMFDIDLKIKFGISRTTVAAIIAAVAFVGSELVEQAFGVEQTWPAIAIAGLIALAFKPLAAIGNRLADRVMPGVEDTEDYRGRRAHEVYRAAYESALQDGDVTSKEKRMLESLVEQLGLSAGDARALERQASRPSAAAKG